MRMPMSKMLGFMETIKFKEFEIQVDVEETRDFYKHQNSIMEDCGCSDCKYFHDTFSKLPFSVYEFLIKSGVNLQKNLNDEPTGVHCAVENDRLIFSVQENIFIGKLPQKELEFDYDESNFNFKVYFYHLNESEIKVQIDIAAN